MLDTKWDDDSFISKAALMMTIVVVYIFCNMHIQVNPSVSSRIQSIDERVHK